MEYPFPAISSFCPVCRGVCGAIYRGYYRRWCICPEPTFVGWVAIRTGYCKAKRRRFALFPEFLIPFRGFSRTAILWLWRAWKNAPSEFVQVVDRWFEGIENEIYLSSSTLYAQLRFVGRQLQAGTLLFDVRPISPGALGDRDCAEVESAILHPAFGLASNLRIDPPP